MKIAFDVAGFENELSEAIKAAVRFTKLNPDVAIILVGDEARIKGELPKGSALEIVHASQVVTMEDDIGAIRSKPDSSMLVAINLVVDNKADAVFSAGSTAPFVAACSLLIGPIKGIRRAAFMPWLPSSAPGGTYLLDAGANKECSAEDLRQFAIMGAAFSRLITGKNKPVVKVLNIGTEPNKGLALQDESNRLLQNEPMVNYQGFIESRDLLGKDADVVVCDGYSGNIALKSMEGALRKMIAELKKAYKKPWGWLGGLFSLPVLLHLAKKFDYRNNAGALVIGLAKVAVKTHGSADYDQFMSSLRMCKQCVANNIVGTIEAELAKPHN